MGDSDRDLFPGALEMMVLQILRRGPSHGYALVQSIKQLSGDLLQVEEGSLYPALQRLGRWPMTFRGAFLLLAFAASQGLSQTTTPIRRTFDVVSVKSNHNGGYQIFIDTRPGPRIVAKNVPLSILLSQAFRPLQDSQIVGGPSWINSDRCDVEANAGEPISADQMGPALQFLLEDRFQLKTHREIREMPVYVLTIAKGGLKLKAVTPPLPGGGAVLGGGPGYYKALARPIDTLTGFLAAQLGRPVIDRTELKGYYDLELKFTPEQLPGVPQRATPVVADPTSGTIFTALQEQMGLKLESGGKAPIEVLVIDSAQHPSEN
jgi:uncharacterized protein (TIGR03435 family)